MGELSNNNLPIFLAAKNPHVSIINDSDIDCLLQKVVLMQRTETSESYSLTYFADLYRKRSLFNKFKQSHIDRITYKNKIIKVKKPRGKLSLYDQYTIASSLGCASYSFDSDDDSDDSSTTDSELDISELSDDNWEINKLSDNSDTILSWLENDRHIKNYVLSYDGDPIIYFNDIEKAQIYLKHISTMVVEKLKVTHFPDNFRLTKIDDGYQIDICIWSILIPIYIKYSKIILVPIFEIN